MALFENYEGRMPQLQPVLDKYGFKNFDEVKAYTNSKGVDAYSIVESTQPICFENVKWAYELGAAIAMKEGVKTAAEAAQKIQGLKKKLKDNNFSFGDIIPVLLTDNGGEFSIVSAFEDDEFGNRETNLFFCEPSSPNEKPEIEKNHTLFRDIVPAGHSFDAFTQQDVNLIFSHINAVKRKQFGGKSAYDLFTFFNSVELAQILGISYISPNDVIQSPLLLKKL